MWLLDAHGPTVGPRGTEGGLIVRDEQHDGARESRSSATVATSRSRSRAPFKVGSSTLSTLAEHRALEGELQALENGWREKSLDNAWRPRGHVRSLFLQVMPFLPLLFGLIQCGGTLIELRRGTFRSSVLEQLAVSLFFASLSILFLLILPWAVLGNLPRYAMYLGLAVVAAHGVVASILAIERASSYLRVPGGLLRGLLVLMSLACLLGVGHVLLAPVPDDQILMVFPAEGVWSVGQGGPSVLTNTHVRYANERYALDLVKVGPDGKCFKADGRQLQDYFSWGQAVRAPLSGTVIEAIETYPDNEPGRVDDGDSRGNHVLIRSVAGENVLLAHLRKESVLVEKGDSVQEGQLIAEVGNSGNTSAPHLHIEASRATKVVVSVFRCSSRKQGRACEVNVEARYWVGLKSSILRATTKIACRSSRGHLFFGAIKTNEEEQPKKHLAVLQSRCQRPQLSARMGRR